MLCFSKRQVRADTCIYQLLQHLGGQIQDEDRSVRGALIFGLTGFEDGEVNGLFPNCWEVGPLVREVEKLCEITDSKRSRRCFS